MLDFLQANAPIVSAAASLGTLCIWAIYLHIFVVSHHRQLKPMIVINRGEGRTFEARCLVTNMSREPVHIQSVMARILTPDGEHRAYITDAEDLRAEGKPSHWERMTRQGPLASGMMVDMGSYGAILDYTAQACCGHAAFEDSELADRATMVEISILGIYGSEDLMIGASREFTIDRSGEEPELRARVAETRQITRHSERKLLARELAEQL